MNNHQILIKAIDKAKNNGYKLSATVQDKNTQGSNYYLDYNESRMIIFSHDFAKAFWGDKSIIDLRGTKFQKDTDETESIELGLMVTWQFHLQQMVLEPEPLKYLEKFLEK